mmetsp:Transcript_51135/g.147561  ORF Transcript_51135/g.147561 Transcript_51135/m.147561 type:complete len:312 (+) Transcript_51135:57-992(+)
MASTLAVRQPRRAVAWLGVVAVSLIALGAEAARSSTAALLTEQSAAAAAQSASPKAPALARGAEEEDRDESEDSDDDGSGVDEAAPLQPAGWEFERDLLLEHLREDPEAWEQYIDAPLLLRQGPESARALALLVMLGEPLTKKQRERLDELPWKRRRSQMFIAACQSLKLQPEETQRVLEEFVHLMMIVGADGKFIRDVLSAMFSMLQTLHFDAVSESVEWMEGLQRRLREELPATIKKFARKHPALAEELRWRMTRLYELLNVRIGSTLDVIAATKAAPFSASNAGEDWQQDVPIGHIAPAPFVGAEWLN